MRGLTIKQKKLLTEYFNENKGNIFGFNHVDNFPIVLWDELRELHDTEILYQICNSFINDLLHE